MRILLIHQAFCGPNDPGGTRHYEIVSRLAAQGHEVTIVTSRYSYLTGAAKDDCSYLAGIRLRFTRTLGDLHKSYVQRLLAFLSFAVSSFFVALRSGPHDIILGTSPPIFQCFPALCVALLRKKPFVLEVRDLWPDFAIALGLLRNSLLIGAAKTSEKLLYRFACAVVVNSPRYTRYLEQHGVPKWKIILIANGVDPCAFNPKDKGEEFRAEYGLSNSFVVMYAGALGLANGVESLIEAAFLLRHEPDLKVVIVGDGKHKSKLQAMARSIGLSNVLFVPAQPKTRIPRILAAADVCVALLANVPSLQITYPNKVFDYMAAGRPTVLAIQGPIREIIERSGGGVSVNPGDSSALAEAFLRLRRSPLLRAEMGVKARSYVEQYFNRADQAKQFADLLERIAAPQVLTRRSATISISSPQGESTPVFVAARSSVPSPCSRAGFTSHQARVPLTRDGEP